jgi:hypothetical protein
MVEKLMAHRLKKSDSNRANGFPPEADDDFDMVPDDEINALRERMRERFGIGEKRLIVIEEPRPT